MSATDTRRLKWRQNSPSARTTLDYMVMNGELVPVAVLIPTPIKYVGNNNGGRNYDCWDGHVELNNRNNDYVRHSPKSGKAKVERLEKRIAKLNSKIEWYATGISMKKNEKATNNYGIDSYISRFRDNCDDCDKIRRVIMYCFDFEVDQWITRLGQLTRENVKLMEDAEHMRNRNCELQCTIDEYEYCIAHNKSEIERIQPRLPWELQEQNKSKVAYHEYFTKLGKKWQAGVKAHWKAKLGIS